MAPNVCARLARQRINTSGLQRDHGLGRNLYQHHGCFGRHRCHLGCGNARSPCLEHGTTSFNWTNYEASTTTPYSTQDFLTYYTPSTVGQETSGATLKANFTYTVPFQAYQLNPGSTFDQSVGTTLTEQLASGFKIMKNGGASSRALALPTGFTSLGATTGSIQEVGAVKSDASGTMAIGFTTSVYNVQTSTQNDGSGKDIQEEAGIFYNYAASNYTSSSLGGLNMASSPNTGELNFSSYFGPSYVAWTAPLGVTGNGTAVLSVKADDFNNADDGSQGMYVFTSLPGGYASPLMQVTNITTGPGLVTNTGFGGWHV